MRVFLSYRRDDAGGYAGRLTDALLQRLGPRSVFQDVTAISPGQDYTVAIDRALADSDAVLAVIGPGWLTAAAPQGTPRLLEAGDYVHLELARALRRDIRVIPVLVGGKWQVILATTVENVGQQVATMGSWKYQHLIVAQRYNNVACFTSTHGTIDPRIIDDERVGFDVNCKPTGRLVLQLDSGSISVTPDTQNWGSC